MMRLLCSAVLLLAATVPARAADDVPYALYVAAPKTYRVCDARGCWTEARGLQTGSGVAVGRVPEGVVALTAAHVLVDVRTAEAPPATVTVWWGKRAQYKARVVRVDRANDIAVLLLPAEAATVVPLVPLAPALPAPGTRVWIEGYPASRRAIAAAVVRQHVDASGITWYSDGLSQGASGGPVRDERGQLVGLMTLREVQGPASCGPALARCKAMLQACFGRLPEVEATTVVVSSTPQPAVIEPAPMPPAPSGADAELEALRAELATLKARPIRVEIKDPVTGEVKAREFAPGEPIRLQLPSVPVPTPAQP